MFEKKFYSTKNSTPPSLSPLPFQQLSLLFQFFWFINNTIDDHWLIIRNNQAQHEQRSFFWVRSQIFLLFLYLLDLFSKLLFLLKLEVMDLLPSFLSKSIPLLWRLNFINDMLFILVFHGYQLKEKSLSGCREECLGSSKIIFLFF